MNLRQERKRHEGLSAYFLIFHVHTTKPNEAEADLTPLAELTELKELSLILNPIPDDQMEMLRKALPNCRIEF